jgi:nitrilase
MSTTNDWDRNLEKMRRHLAEAAGKGARVVAFPEMAYFMGKQSEWSARLDRHESLLSLFSGWAREYGVTLLPGSIREPAGGGRYFNTQWAWNARGEVIARYRKIFLFRADLPDRQYREAQYCDPGSEITTFDADGMKLGLAICYDLRFPELFRALRARGAQAILLPASFTVPTGTAHWQVLLRARAIENQVFVLAPAQVGEVGDGARTYGHTCGISPWGEVLGDLDDAEGVLCLDLELARIAEATSRVDAWASRREDLFPNNG